MKLQEETKYKDSIIEELQGEKQEVIEGMETTQILRKLQKIEPPLTVTKDRISSGGEDSGEIRTIKERTQVHRELEPEQSKSAIIIRSLDKQLTVERIQEILKIDSLPPIYSRFTRNKSSLIIKTNTEDNTESLLKIIEQI